uniref:Predicted protein n=1 Tax=Hordeum vulgare subsp. vulgare TaxID=112509 RepID=F2DP56_HORVV|nr:predicted protein [Hordeum vulgare subsp. vulgare]
MLLVARPFLGTLLLVFVAVSSASHVASAAGAACPSSLARVSPISLSPATWPAGELDKYTALNLASDQDKPEGSASAQGGIVTGTAEALAVHVGTDCLRKGGNAIDCALAVSLTQITLALGEYVSFLGHTFLVSYNASQGQVHSINGGFNVPLGESDPRSIPGCSVPAPNNGRTVPVPAVFSAFQLAADCYGSLPWSTLFDAPLYFATHGFPLTRRTVAVMFSASVFPILNATAEGRHVLYDDQGAPRRAGQMFYQPELADLLQKIATQGAAYAYQGDMATRLATAVQSNGGTLSVTDLAQYQALLVEPVRQNFSFPYQQPSRAAAASSSSSSASFSSSSSSSTSTSSSFSSSARLSSSLNVEVFANGFPSNGGLHVIEALNLLELYAANGVNFSIYPDDAAAVGALFRVSSYSWLVGVVCELVTQGPALLSSAFQSVLHLSVDFSSSNRVTKTYAATIYRVLTDPTQQAGLRQIFQKFLAIKQKASSSSGSPPPDFSLLGLSPHDHEASSALDDELRELHKYIRGSHSAAVIVSDPQGNVVSLLHSINSDPYGTGIFVDGVAVPNAFCSQQKRILLTGAGNRVPDEVEPLIVLANGKPIMAGSEIGAGLREVSMVKALLMLSSSRFGAKTANEARDFYNAVFPSAKVCHGDASRVGCHFPLNVTVSQGAFSDSVLATVRASGQGVTEIPSKLVPYSTGFWVGARFDGVDGSAQTASAPHRLNGWAEGFS